MSSQSKELQDLLVQFGHYLDQMTNELSVAGQVSKALVITRCSRWFRRHKVRVPKEFWPQIHKLSEDRIKRLRDTPLSTQPGSPLFTTQRAKALLEKVGLTLDDLVDADVREAVLCLLQR